MRFLCKFVIIQTKDALCIFLLHFFRSVSLGGLRNGCCLHIWLLHYKSSACYLCERYAVNYDAVGTTVVLLDSNICVALFAKRQQQQPHQCIEHNLHAHKLHKSVSVTAWWWLHNMRGQTELIRSQRAPHTHIHLHASSKRVTHQIFGINTNDASKHTHRRTDDAQTHMCVMFACACECVCSLVSVQTSIEMSHHHSCSHSLTSRAKIIS